MKLVDDILHYWFGQVEETGIPTEHRSQIWFGGTPGVDQEIKDQFNTILHDVIDHKHDDWREKPRSLLALIIVLDQFSRHIFRENPRAFEQDSQALEVCLYGIKHEFDHEVSLIERAFLYMPLMHAEDLQMQVHSVRAYKTLADLSFPETHQIFFEFLTYAIKHYEAIKVFNRFPQRNAVLNRESTPEEKKFLEEYKGGWQTI